MCCIPHSLGPTRCGGRATQRCSADGHGPLQQQNNTNPKPPNALKEEPDAERGGGMRRTAAGRRDVCLFVACLFVCLWCCLLVGSIPRRHAEAAGVVAHVRPIHRPVRSPLHVGCVRHACCCQLTIYVTHVAMVISVACCYALRRCILHGARAVCPKP